MCGGFLFYASVVSEVSEVEDDESGIISDIIFSISLFASVIISSSVVRMGSLWAGSVILPSSVPPQAPNTKEIRRAETIIAYEIFFIKNTPLRKIIFRLELFLP